MNPFQLLLTRRHHRRRPRLQSSNPSFPRMRYRHCHWAHPHRHLLLYYHPYRHPSRPHISYYQYLRS